ncbi:hypothetical protein SUDANB106_00306 [Streptomyces sp. enrichment culture]|uniref:hypothetical protein n=1 Tax=Streptomyces sp. enrichment culture TaxID=1795815 RepID=UPI003F57B213
MTDQQAAEIRIHGVGPFLLTHFRGMAETGEREQARPPLWPGHSAGLRLQRRAP